MRRSEVLQKNRQAIRETTTRFNASYPGVFDWVARCEGRPEQGDFPWRLRVGVLQETKPV